MFQQPELAFEPERSLEPDCTGALFQNCFLLHPLTTQCDPNIRQSWNCIGDISVPYSSLADLARTRHLGPLMMKLVHSANLRKFFPGETVMVWHEMIHPMP